MNVGASDQGLLTLDQMFEVEKVKLPGGKVRVRYVELRERTTFVDCRVQTKVLDEKEVERFKKRIIDTDENKASLERYNNYVLAREAARSEKAAQRKEFIAKLPAEIREMLNKRIIIQNFVEVSFDVAETSSGFRLECHCSPDASTVEVSTALGLITMLKPVGQVVDKQRSIT